MIIIKGIIVSRRCDEPMARSKHLFPCNKDCKNCIACIERDDGGAERHALGGQRDQVDYKLMLRNMSIMRGRDHVKR